MDECSKQTLKSVRWAQSDKQSFGKTISSPLGPGNQHGTLHVQCAVLSMFRSHATRHMNLFLPSDWSRRRGTEGRERNGELAWSACCSFGHTIIVPPQVRAMPLLTGRLPPRSSIVVVFKAVGGRFLPHHGWE